MIFHYFCSMNLCFSSFCYLASFDSTAVTFGSHASMASLHTNKAKIAIWILLKHLKVFCFIELWQKLMLERAAPLRPPVLMCVCSLFVKQIPQRVRMECGIMEKEEGRCGRTRPVMNLSQACWHSRSQMGLHACQASKLWEDRARTDMSAFFHLRLSNATGIIKSINKTRHETRSWSRSMPARGLHSFSSNFQSKRCVLVCAFQMLEHWNSPLGVWFPLKV